MEAKRTMIVTSVHHWLLGVIIIDVVFEQLFYINKSITTTTRMLAMLSVEDNAMS